MSNRADERERTVSADPRRDRRSWVGELRYWHLASALLAMMLLTHLSGLLHNSPTWLPQAWLPAGMGVALIVTIRPELRTHAVWGIALATALGSMASTGVALALAQGGILALQTKVVARGIARKASVWSDKGRHGYSLRLMRLLHLSFGLVIPSAAVAGFAMSLLLSIPGGVPAEATWTPWLLGLIYSVASTTSILLLAPFLCRERAGGSLTWTGAAMLALTTVAASLSLNGGPAVWSLPVVMLLAGYLCGLWIASAAAAIVAVVLTVGVHVSGSSHFAGPDGFVIWLLVILRLTITGYLAAVWSDRRQCRGTVDGARAVIHANVAALCAALRASGRPAGHESALLVSRGDRIRISAATSQRLMIVARRVTSVLRSKDCVVHLGDSGLLVVLRDVPRDVLAVIADRVRVVVHRTDAELAVATLPLDGDRLHAWLDELRHLEAGGSGDVQIGAGRQPAGQAPTV